jgi:hypothetical protein
MSDFSSSLEEFLLHVFVDEVLSFVEHLDSVFCCEAVGFLVGFGGVAVFGILVSLLLRLLLLIHQSVQEKEIIHLLDLNRIDLFKEEVVVIVEVSDFSLGADVVNVFLENSFVIFCQELFVPLRFLSNNVSCK